MSCLLGLLSYASTVLVQPAIQAPRVVQVSRQSVDSPISLFFLLRRNMSSACEQRERGISIFSPAHDGYVICQEAGPVQASDKKRDVLNKEKEEWAENAGLLRLFRAWLLRVMFTQAPALRTCLLERNNSSLAG